MKNKKCPQRKVCWGYVNSSCEDCNLGKAINRLYKKIDILKAENMKLKSENEELNHRIEIITFPNF